MTKHHRPRANFKKLTAAEARRALYIDFEGQTGQDPVLLGTFVRGRGHDPKVPQFVLDPLFEPAGTETRTIRRAIETVVMRAEKKNRRIVAWTEHDLDVIRRLVPEDPELIARLETRYANAKLVAERWADRLHPETRPTDNTLAAFLDFIAWPVPQGAGRGRTGPTIAAMRKTLAGGRPLTDNQRKRWADLLAHNQHDCAGMRKVCLRATRELESA